MKIFLILILSSLSVASFGQKYVDLHNVVIGEEYSVAKMLPAKVVPKRQSVLGFEASGKVREIKVDVGDKVIKGQLLAELEDAEALARLAEAKANMVMAKNIFERSRTLGRTNNVSEQRLENEELKFKIAKAQHQVAMTKVQQTKIRAPYTGFIQSRLLDEGSTVNPSISVLEILDSEYVEARVNLPKSIYQEVSLGKTYSFLVDKEKVDASLTRLAPMSSKGSNNRLAIFSFETFFNPGATARLVFKIKNLKRGAWVPLSALSQAEQGLWSVFTLSQDSSTQKDFVELIHIEKDMAYVSGTLRTGDQVIVGGASKVAEGQSVRGSQ
jgi:RND family efflux transporter MFP subunit